MPKLLVAAIDFGTTFSGYAFAFKTELDDDRMKIQYNQAWNAGQSSLLSLKTPTCLLLKADATFKSFGYQAENDYSIILADGNADEYYFFYRFKMALHGYNELPVDMKLKEVGGKELDAIEVFALSIKALKTSLEELLQLRGTTLEPDEIDWVLTVPAIWSDSAKQFMRKACIRAGMKDDSLRIALEPEAASIYCQHVPTERLGGNKFLEPQVGTRYMVIDLGGGTADITVHEKREGNKLREIYKASGGASGGTAVDRCFLGLFRQLFGNEVVDILQTEEVEAYMDLCREFEVTKRSVKPASNGKVTISFPYVALDEICQKVHEKKLKEVLASSSMAKQIGIVGNKLRIDDKLVEGIFQEVIDEIIDYIKQILDQPEVQGISRFLLVGGFSECAMIQHAIKEAFPEIRVIIPSDPGLAVVKGAVLFGNEPDTITSRVIKYSYGVKTAPVFDPDIHDPNYMFMSGGLERCANVFSSFMRAGTSASNGFEVIKKYKTNEAYQKEIPVEVFYSISVDPRYTNQSCVQRLGMTKIKIKNPTKDPRIVEVHFLFGDTELSVRAYDLETRAELTGESDFCHFKCL